MSMEMLEILVGVFMFIMGVSMLFSPVSMRSTLKAICDSKGLSGLQAMVKLIFGVYIINMYNVWEMQWETLITFVGWFMALTATLRLCVMDQWDKIAKRLLDEKNFMYVSAIYLIIGGYILMKVFY